jgi:hypothetical protein
MAHYATIGTNGTRPVVWGMGVSPEASEKDARKWLCELGDPNCKVDLLTLQVTEEQAQRIGEDGEVSTEVLGIKLPASWLIEHQGC